MLGVVDVADVVVAGQRQPRHREVVEPGAAVGQVGALAGPVAADVTGVHDEVRVRRGDVGHDGVPVLVGVRHAGPEVGVADVDDAQRHGRAV